MDKIFLTDLDREQRRHLEDARELWEAWALLWRRRDELAGALAWKTVKDRQYLVRYWQDEDTGEKRMTSLGPRSPETEKRKEDWERDRKEVDAAVARFKGRLEALGRVGKALRVGRLEKTPAAVLRQLWRAGAASRLVVAGSAALHLYEASAGVLVPNAVLPHGDLDLMAVGEEVDPDDLLRFLRRADDSFRRPGEVLSFVNADGFRVDVFPDQTLRRFFANIPDLSSDQRRIVDDAFELAPVTAIGVARDGLPVPMAGIDPRTFVILKYVRAEFDPGRHRNAAEIDRDQAFAIGTLVRGYWRQEFDPAWLEAFPGLAEGLADEAPDGGEPRLFM